MVGQHWIRSWSSTQKTIALSSGEAELTALVKASCETIGVTQLAADWGLKWEGAIWVDSSAALGVVNSRGNGKLRHVRVGQLWVQEKRESKELEYKKVKGRENPADLMTKGVSAVHLNKHMARMGLAVFWGRAESSLVI